MKKILIISTILVLFFGGSSALAEKNGVDIIDLTPWKGYNVANLQLYRGKAAEKFFAEVAKYAPKGYTQKMVKDFVDKAFFMKFKSLKVVDKDTITINDKISGDYVHVGKLFSKWKEHYTPWNIFKTDSKEMIEAGYKYFLLMPFHQHGKNSLSHAHVRYGNQGFDFLATDPSVQSWWPALYQPALTDEAKIMTAMIKKARLQASMLPPLE